jgi:hypothetical protein
MQGPEGRSSKQRQPSPEGLGIDPNEFERRRRGTYLIPPGVLSSAWKWLLGWQGFAEENAYGAAPTALRIRLDQYPALPGWADVWTNGPPGLAFIAIFAVSVRGWHNRQLLRRHSGAPRHPLMLSYGWHNRQLLRRLFRRSAASAHVVVWLAQQRGAFSQP